MAKGISLADRNLAEAKRFPIVLLLCDSNPFSIVRYLERAFYDLTNLVVVNLDVQEWFLKRFGLPKLFYKLFRVRLNHLPILPRDPDLILAVEPYTKTHLDLSRFPSSAKAFYALDPHSPNSSEAYKKCRVWEYDYVFCGQKDYIPMLKDLGCKKVNWLPYAVDPMVFRELKNMRVKYDVAFLGAMTPDRKDILARVSKKFKLLPVGHGKGAYYMHDASIAYSMSNIVLQISNRGTIGARIFEGMACNRLVMADKICNGLDELTRDGTDIVLYRGASELEEKIGYYLKNEEEMKKIAVRGYQLATTKHTYRHRVDEVLRVTVGETIHNLS